MPILGQLEQHFGGSFSDVRVHTDSTAADAARSLKARAFTIGSNIYFGAGQYNVLSRSGRGLIGHEVAHVDQMHRGLVGPGPHGYGPPGTGTTNAERFAEGHERRFVDSPATVPIQVWELKTSAALDPASVNVVGAIAARAIQMANDSLALETPEADVGVMRVPLPPLNDSHDAEDNARIIATIVVRAARTKALRMRFGNDAPPAPAPVHTLSELPVIGGVIVPPGNVGLPRDYMPQIADENYPDFFHFCEVVYKAKISMAPIPVTVLKGTQREANFDKVMERSRRSLARQMGGAPVIVSSDYYILDGHHRWAGLHTWAIAHPDERVPEMQTVYFTNMNIDQLLAACWEYEKTGYSDVNTFSNRPPGAV
jgi:hypothetical protein